MPVVLVLVFGGVNGGPMADVQLLPRPLSDHLPIIWQTHEGIRQCIHYKMNRSWLWKDGFREEVVRWWNTQPRQVYRLA